MFGRPKAIGKDIDPETGVAVAPVNLDPQAVPHFEKSKEEKRFLIKLDIFLLTFGCLSQIIKYLDQTNITFAYTSGMSEDLNLKGNELNYFTTYFNVGYCIFLIPSQIIITRIRPSLWLSSLEFFWGVLTGCIAACKTPQQIYAIRALIGMLESSAYPGAVTLLMTWYTPLEMAKRIGFYHSCQGIGSMLAGALQAAIYESLNGKHGIAGWQWTFIINCIMTLIVACLGVFMIPDFPSNPNPRSFWLKSGDSDIQQARLDRFNRVSPNAINLKCALRTIKNPILYMMIYIYVGLLIAPSGNGYMNLFLKSLTNPDGSKVWSVAQLSTIPMAGYSLQVGAVWIFAYGSDYFRTRWLMLLIICILGLPPCVVMSIWNVPLSAKYYGYFMMFFVTAGGPPLWSWMSDMLPHDAEQRALIIGICISLYYAINAWSNVLIWPAVQAPHYKYGWQVAVALWITVGIVIVTMRIYDIKVIRPRNYAARMAEDAQYNAGNNIIVSGPVIQTQIDVDRKDPVSTNIKVTAVPEL